MDTKSAMIFFTSVQTKREAEVKIKKMLGQMAAKGVMVRDLFLAERKNEVRGPNKVGYKMKTAGKCEMIKQWLGFREYISVNKRSRSKFRVLVNK
jgi:hypothetical protein